MVGLVWQREAAEVPALQHMACLFIPLAEPRVPAAGVGQETASDGEGNRKRNGAGEHVSPPGFSSCSSALGCRRLLPSGSGQSSAKQGLQVGAVPWLHWQGCTHLEFEPGVAGQGALFWTCSSPPDSITLNLYGLGLFNTVVQIGLQW